MSFFKLTVSGCSSNDVGNFTFFVAVFLFVKNCPISFKKFAILRFAGHSFSEFLGWKFGDY